jgi:hypothetical protein
LTTIIPRLMVDELTGSTDTRLPSWSPSLPEAAPSHWRTPPVAM